jgi:hypothetical protein
MEVNAVRISKPVRGVQRPQPTAVRGSSCRHVFCGPGRAVQPRCAARCPNPHRCHAGWPAWVLATGPYPSPCYKHSPSWHASNGHGRPPTHRGCLGGLDNCDLNSNTKDLHPAEARFLCNQRSADRCCKGLGCCDSRFLLRCCKECGSPHDALRGLLARSHWRAWRLAAMRLDRWFWVWGAATQAFRFAVVGSADHLTMHCRDCSRCCSGGRGVVI